MHGWGRHQALLSGWNVTDVVVSGAGVINGRGSSLDSRLNSSWASRFTAYKACEHEPDGCAGASEAQILQFGRPRVWEPMFSQSVALLDVHIVEQAFWAVHPYACDDVHIAGINITAPRDEGIPNDDGIDPDSSSNVLVEQCWVSVGDNSVAIKSGMNWAGRQLHRASFNHVWRDSVFASETFAIGSEMSGGVFNITVDNCVFGTDGSDFAGFHIKAPRPRGGSVHAIRVINSVFHLESSTKQQMPISVSMFYGSLCELCVATHRCLMLVGRGSSAKTNTSDTPRVYDVQFRNLTMFLPSADATRRQSTPTFQFLGLHDSPLSDFRFEDIKVVSGHFAGWQCVNTSRFSFERVDPAPEPGSGCI